MTGWALFAIALVIVATVVVGAYGVRFSRTTSDFLVASRTVSPVMNAAAIGGEYLSAASFLGIAGLVLTYGVDMLWFPIGYTAGFLVVLVLVAAPLRRSGAFTLPDFAEGRLQSPTIRWLVAVLVVAIGWLYLLPQLQGAGLTLQTMTGAPSWAGAVVVAVVVLLTVMGGGMRSITFVQAFQYWLKVTAIAVPTLFLLAVWRHRGAPWPSDPHWSQPLSGFGGRAYPLYSTYSLVVATMLGTMGLPHILVRFYTNRDGRAARRTTVGVLLLLSLFYVFPPILGALGRLYTPELAGTPAADTVVLVLPERMVGGGLGAGLSALAAAGAFAAFLSTASGLTVAVAGVMSQFLARLPRRPSPLRGGVARFRLGTGLALVVPLAGSLLIGRADLAQTVAQAFAVSATTFAPLLILGIWWRGLTVKGAVWALCVGGAVSLGAVLVTLFFGTRQGLWGVLLAEPAAWSVPLAFAVAIVVSRLTRASGIPAGADGQLMLLHLPETLERRASGTEHASRAKPSKPARTSG
jgi:cation/acetate symporter